MNRFVGGVRQPGDGVDGFYEQAITLDDFAQTHPAPDFIKMDIEGGEPKPSLEHVASSQRANQSSVLKCTVWKPRNTSKSGLGRDPTITNGCTLIPSDTRATWLRGLTQPPLSKLQSFRD